LFGGTWLRRIAVVLPALAGGPALAWEPGSLFAPCEGDCATAIYAGNYVDTPMGEALLASPQLPFAWHYEKSDHLVATSLSRIARSFWRFTLEPEVGIGQRFGRQRATELWGALFLRYQGFPWDDRLVTTFAVSFGLNWASEVTKVEQERADDDTGARWMHFFAPEVTLALPSHPNVQLMFRFHHRSGMFGLINDTGGAAQYGTVGLRVWF
jgi:hypothetical protein